MICLKGGLIDLKFFDSQLNWYKGNTHTHTTVSDGQLTPEQATALYRSRGYDFLALTDHGRVSQTVEGEDFLLLSGVEIDCVCRSQAYHLVGIGMDRQPNYVYEPSRHPQDLIDILREAGAFVILAHPAWSLLRVDVVECLSGIGAAEVFNSVSRTPWNGDRGDSSGFLDVLASSSGVLLPFIAADDAHFYSGEECCGYTMVNTRSLTREGILEALFAGRFYASQGPAIEQVQIEDGVVTVTCSPASMAVFYTDAFYNAARAQVAQAGTEFTYTLSPMDHFVRCEIIDAQGRKAWTSPVAVREMD